MLSRLKPYSSAIYSGLIGLFFILILLFKASYSVIPILLVLAGCYFVYQKIKHKQWAIPKAYRFMVTTFVIYFLLFVLSLLIHHGKAKELDLPSRALLVLPIFLLLFSVKLKVERIISALLIAANVVGIVAVIQVFALHLDKPFPQQMHIQAGGFAMSLALFCLCLFFYFFPKPQRLPMLFSLTGFLLGLVASVLTTARGAWVALPLLFIVILYLYRAFISKKLVIGVVLLSCIGFAFNASLIEKRLDEAQNEVQAYVEQQNGSTSVGARFDMWKSALIGIQEKPLFGWGIEGVKEMRKQHFEQGLISEFASQFAHSHNQYLQDASTRGVLGLTALLAVFLAPLSLFWRNLKHAAAGSLSYLFGSLGIVHIVSVMCYCLSQSFLSHNSGTMFYFFGVVVFLALQKITENRPLEAV